MANDLMGELGLDTEQFEKALDRCSDKVGNRFTSSLKKVGVALGFAFSARAIAGYVKSFASLREEIEATRKSFARGTEEFQKYDRVVSRAGGSSSGGIFKRASIEAKTYLDAVKARLATMTSELTEGMTRSANPLHPGRETEMTKKLQAEAAQDRDYEASMKRLEKVEEDISRTRGQDLGQLKEQADLLKLNVKLSNDELDVLGKKVGVTQQEMDAARAKSGEALQQWRDFQFRHDATMRSLEAETAALEDQTRGLQNVGDAMRKIAEIENKRRQAEREGNIPAAQQFEAQKAIAEQDLKIVEHNMTARERMSERAVARKRDRDLKKSERHESDLEKRRLALEARGGRATPGSELDRYINRMVRAKAAEAAALGRKDADTKPTIEQIGRDASAISKKLDNAFINR